MNRGAYREKVLRDCKKRIEILDKDLDRQFSIIQDFKKVEDLQGPIGASIAKMIDQYKGRHRKIAIEMDQEFKTIISTLDEKVYTKEEIEAILARRDGKLNDWFNKYK